MSKTLDDLKKKQAQIQARIQATEARERDKERKERTSRNIVVGALVSHHVNANPQSDIAKLVTRLVDEYTYTKSHRRLFDLPSLSPDEEKERRARARSKKVHL